MTESQGTYIFRLSLIFCQTFKTNLKCNLFVPSIHGTQITAVENHKTVISGGF